VTECVDGVRPTPGTTTTTESTPETEVTMTVPVTTTTLAPGQCPSNGIGQIKIPHESE
jgi:hypothetical protein